jgi:hypothetical protein
MVCIFFRTVLSPLSWILDPIREVSHRIAVAIVKEAIRDGLAKKVSAEDAENLDDFVALKMYYWCFQSTSLILCLKYSRFTHFLDLGLE